MLPPLALVKTFHIQPLHANQVAEDLQYWHQQQNNRLSQKTKLSSNVQATK